MHREARGVDQGRLERQLEFLREADKLKSILRRSRVSFADRRENDAEHSWHLALMVMTLVEYAEPGIDLLRTLQMALVHDIVEIDAGDTIAYASAAEQAAQAEREQAAAERLFGLLPPDQGARIRALFDEFEARRTPEARFARALDRAQAILQNLHTAGAAWQQSGVTVTMVRELNQPTILAASAALWEHIDGRLAEAEARGWFAKG
ncbi:MAG: HD domain-containing protein [Polyangiaceae bacterium]|nr:HD domain-containing protein [Polyangiaceae bacterium]